MGVRPAAVAAAGGTVPAYTSVVPSANGSPNSVATQGAFAYVSVQGAGAIYTYNISSGTPVGVSTYTTPCADPSGIAVAHISGANVLAVVCYDSSSLLTLTMNANGTLAPLGSVAGLAAPFPGLAIDGTDVYIPLYGLTLTNNGAVAKVSIATPASPSITATTTLLSSPAGGFSNPGFLTVDSGYVYVAAGSESQPQATTSTIQVLRESTMALVGTPLVVDHSPQEIAISQGYAFVTFYDAGELQSLDVTNPASLQPIETISLTQQGVGCSALPVVVFELYAYVGCYGQSRVLRYNIGDPSNMTLSQTLTGIDNPERMVYSVAYRYLLAVGSNTGGSFYEIDGGRF